MAPPTEEVDEVLSALRALPAPPPAEDAKRLVSAIFHHAPGLSPLLLRNPALAAAVLRYPLRRDRTAAGIGSDFRKATQNLDDGPELFRVLRELRHQEVLRIAAREILGLADIDQTSREMALLASAAIESALATVTRSREAAHGVARGPSGDPIPQVVLGMGKLGGGELNLGSDVDLCFFYATDDGQVGDGSVSVHEHFGRIASKTTKVLGEVTEDGFCFRVDLRLRPEGTRGPLVNSLAGAERYYETYGRPWERAALLRARPIAGDADFGEELLSALRPFVFRRAVDPSIAVAMGEMLARSRKEHSVDQARDVKLGRGGIREAEFFVQALQLVWGGRHRDLQVAGTVEAASRLRALGLMSEREEEALTRSWALLRRVEHRIHMRAAYQTHALPVLAAERASFAASLGFEDVARFEVELEAARDAVAELFASLTEDEPLAQSHFAELADLVADAETAEDLEEAVRVAFPENDPDEVAAHLVRLGRRPRSPLGPLTRSVRPELGPMLLMEAAESADASAALRHLADLFGRLGGTWDLSRILFEDPRLTRRLIGLFGASNNLSQLLVQRPELVEEILLRRRPPDAVEIAAVHAAPPLRWIDERPDRETFVAALRTARSSLELGIGLATVAGDLAQPDAEVLLSATADAQIAAALRFALAEREARFGEAGLDENSDRATGMVVLGLGKLGGRELGFGGDLDLVFVFDGPGDDLTRGTEERAPITNAELFTRTAQQTLRLLAEPSAFGRGYHTDARLRPSGSQGMLVVSVDSFARYHEERAAVWERQALTRARPVAGEAAVAARVMPLLERHAYERGEPPATEVAAMRRRMELELAGERPGRYHPKLGYGGLVDVEFIVQWMQMRHGVDPTVRLTNTRAALRALRAAGYVSVEDTRMLLEGHEFFRSIGQALALYDEQAEPVLHEAGRTAARMARRLGIRDRDNARAPEVLLSTWREHATAVRGVFERLIGEVGTPPPWEAS